MTVAEIMGKILPEEERDPKSQVHENPFFTFSDAVNKLREWLFNTGQKNVRGVEIFEIRGEGFFFRISDASLENIFNKWNKKALLLKNNLIWVYLGVELFYVLAGWVCIDCVLAACVKLRSGDYCYQCPPVHLSAPCMLAFVLVYYYQDDIILYVPA